MSVTFKKAEKSKQKLRLLLEGCSGSGKTYSALVLASSLGKKIAVIDTEKGSASLYADKFEFDVLELSAPFNPEKYIEAIRAAEQSGYEVIIIDSLTHEWNGSGGCLDIQAQLGGRYTDWAAVTPRHNRFIETMLQSKCHLISTSRTKTDYEMVESNGKKQIEKVGLKSEQREGMDYEFTVVFRINDKHMAVSTKDRTDTFGKEFMEVITEDTGKVFLDWLNNGKDIAPEQPIISVLDTFTSYIANAGIKDTTEFRKINKIPKTDITKMQYLLDNKEELQDLIDAYMIGV